MIVFNLNLHLVITYYGFHNYVIILSSSFHWFIKNQLNDMTSTQLAC